MDIRVVIVDDSPMFCEKIKSDLSEFSEIEVVKTVTDSTSAIDIIRTLKPDIVLLDIVMPTIDGEEILEILQTTPDVKPAVIVVSSANSDRIIRRCMSLGAHYYMLKPIDINLLVKKIKQTIEEVASEHYDYAANSKETAKEVTEEMVKGRITKFLISSGINPKLKGFFFLKDSIHYVYNSGNDLCSVTKIIYPHVASIYETEPERVERSIRTAIEKGLMSEVGQAFYYNTIEAANAIRSKRPLPSNRQFIFTIAEYIKNTIDDPYAI